MDPVDPLKPLMAGGPPPLTEEYLLQQKKLLKAAKMEPPSASETHDIYTPSPELAAAASRDKYSAFLDVAKPKILTMDPQAQDFLPKATQTMVNSVLSEEYGEHIVHDPGYPQMEAKLTRHILEDPRYKEVIEEFLNAVSLTKS